MAKIPQGEWRAIAARYAKGESLSSIARDYGCTPPAIHYILKRAKGASGGAAEAPALVHPQPAAEKTLQRPSPAAGLRPAVNGERPPAAAQKPLGAARAPALTAELDAALQAHVEAAIQSFRSSFGAALAEASPASRERLRQAAAGLMRAAARTTIVLDRVTAAGKRGPVDTRD
jgi:transposase-like protein